METKKSKNADLERKRGLFFQLGMLLALSAVLAAFQWKEETTSHIILTGGTDWTIPEDIPITKPREPEMKRPQLVSVPIFDIVSSLKDVSDFDIFNVEDAPGKALKPVYFEVPDELPEVDPPIFIIVERKPEFPGGETARLEFIRNNIVYPKLAREVGIEGKVFIGFIVEKDGSLTNFKLKKGIGGGCDEEAMRVAKLMPNWIPGKQREKEVRVSMIMPIDFKLVN